MITGHEKQLRTPLKRARGLGSAKEGVQHWWETRLTSLALIPLTLWFVWYMLTLQGWDYQTVKRSVAMPFNAGLLILLTVITIHHAASGIQTVLEDYVHHEGRKILFIYGVKTIFYALGFAMILSILKLAFNHP